jgi:hypothetical protein
MREISANVASMGLGRPDSAARQDWAFDALARRRAAPMGCRWMSGPPGMGGAAVTIHLDRNSRVGIDLAQRLGLQLNRREGHDLAGPCICCQSSDAFRLHEQAGVGHCFSCHGKWSPFQVAETVLGDRERAIQLLIEIGVFQSNGKGEGHKIPANPIEAIAQEKGITAASLLAFGAYVVSDTAIRLPAYGPDGHACTTFLLTVQGQKGFFAKGKKAGLFFPHVDGKLRLPQLGEVWHLVEGPKDAAALHDLGLLACGLNTCRLATKFARLFAGTEIILIPDRDRAGEEGSQFSAGVLRGVAKSVRIAVLPAEFRESRGDDVRDILRRPGGRDQVLQAIADARPRESDAQYDPDSTPSPAACADILLPEGEPLKLQVWPAGKGSQRLIEARRGEFRFRDRVSTDSSIARDRFVRRLANKAGIKFDTLAPLLEAELTKLADAVDEHDSPRGEPCGDEEQSQATAAVSMAATWDLWHTPGKDGYATVPVNLHQETWLIRSQTFKRLMAKRYFDQTGTAMNSDALGAAVNLLEARALFEGEERTVHVRLAEHGGQIYLDLCNPTWEIVEIGPEGWKIVNESPVRFRRSRGMLALPAPERGGSVAQLRGFLNVDDAAWRLILAWLVAALRPRGPYPILALFADQGSGKSTVGRLLRDLVDPNSAPLRAEPKSGRDLMITASNSWCLAFDNLSYVPPWLSDALCRLSTGGGFATRELYTDQDEVIFDAQRPALLTSIEEVATRPDLLDRCLIVGLPTIPEERRRSEAELYEAFEKVRPQILGALLDAVAVALRRLPIVQLPGLPRLADFALWATAAETAFGWPEGTFMATYQENRKSANDVALEAAIIAQPLLELLEAEGGWSGSASELLRALENRVTDQIKRDKDWPKNPQSLTSHLKRLAANLRAVGWIVEKDRTSRKRSWTIRRDDVPPGSGPTSSSTSSSQGSRESMQPNADRCIFGGDDDGDTNDAFSGQPWNPDKY